MQIELTDEDAVMLRDVLSSYLGDLSMEIRHTDNPRFRRELAHRRAILTQIRAGLPKEAEAV